MNLQELDTSALQEMFHIEMKKFQDGIVSNRPWEELKELSIIIRKLSDELNQRDTYNELRNNRMASQPAVATVGRTDA